MEPITKDRWRLAQAAEREKHIMTREVALHHYSVSYRHNFDFCKINPGNLGGKAILEIGCADVPALYFCENVKGMVIEPLKSDLLDELCEEKNIIRIKGLVEEMTIPYCGEIWLFNVLQHVMDPNVFIRKCKTAAEYIRFFEPVDTDVTDYHPHSFTSEDFLHWFGSIHQYNRTDIEAFHAGPCVYGVWKNEDWKIKT